MREIVRSNDAVLINFIVVILRDAGLSPLLADEHVSAIEGSIGALPRRILVPTDEAERAKRVLEEADLATWISTADGT
ncbi:MAG: DUF2007 domain-containing protein [Alphaproteobacteria bacterium]|nr:DUF2007 domain-containing protein [Alphaproteobacteria bacterium]